ncbi:MAG: hypothetical protein K8E66_00755, partial [Phycisphaerales bacterium]|nr:hypothetical protein [Phycisphaerales bacterium]
MPKPRAHLVFVLVAALAALAHPALMQPALGQGGLLLADDTRTPRMEVSWTRADGTEVSLGAPMPYTSPEERSELGENLEGFIALGGSRLEKGAGHPRGAIVRLGLFKADRDLLMFEDIANGSQVSLRLRGVRFNQDVVPDTDTLLQRLRYKAEDVLACGLTINQTEMFNVVSDDDDMGGTILPEQVRFRCLGGGAPGLGDAR